MKKYADIYAQSKGFLDASSMITHLNKPTTETKMGQIITDMIHGEIITAFKAIDKHNDSNDQAPEAK